VVVLGREDQGFANRHCKASLLQTKIMALNTRLSHFDFGLDLKQILIHLLTHKLGAKQIPVSNILRNKTLDLDGRLKLMPATTHSL
jgi:hypothetical protein